MNFHGERRTDHCRTLMSAESLEGLQKDSTNFFHVV